MKACVALASSTYVRTWRDELARRGTTAAAAPRAVIFTAVPRNPCVDGSVGDVAVASFWCGKNRTVYVSATAAPFWTREYARQAAEARVLPLDAAAVGMSTARMRSGYPLAGAATELAHELGHWVQESTGQMAWYQKRIDSTDVDVSNGYKLASELSADCLAGWVQGRAARDRTWRATPFDRWAQHATMAELGADMTGMRRGFTFPKEDFLAGYGGPYSRLLFYDKGYAAGTSGRAGLSTCAAAAASYTSTTRPPMP